MNPNRENFLHDWIIEEIEKKFSKEYNEIKVNKLNEKNYEFKGSYPDIIFGNYGQIVMIGEVETESDINENIIEKWKNLQSLDISCIVFVPKNKLKDARDLCWNNQLVERLKISTYSVEIPIN